MSSYYGPTLPNYRDWLAHAADDDKYGRDYARRQAALEEVERGESAGPKTKALANHEWYLKNRAKKQAYNKQYYARNKEYWKRRYEDAMSQYSKTDDRINRYRRQAQDSAGYDEFGSPKPISEYYTEKISAAKKRRTYDLRDVRVAELNYQRAINEEQEFIKSKKLIPITEAWKDGASAIVSAGKNLVKKLLGKIKR